MTSEITRWDPFNELRQMRRMMNRSSWPFTPVLREEVEMTGTDETLPVDIFEKDKKLVVKAALPGVNPKDIKVNVTNNILQISAETKSEDKVDEKDYHRREYHYGRVYRSFRLPEDLDAKKCTAKYDNGMLRLEFPRTEQAASRSIDISVK